MNHPHFQEQSRPKTSTSAVWSLILGILSITCLWILGSIPAIILGIGGMKKADADPEHVGGKGLALAGIITGGIGVIAGFILPMSILASLALPAITNTQARAYQTREVSDMRLTLLAMQTYAYDLDGAFPENLMELVEKNYLDSDVSFYTAGPQDVEREMFIYRKGLTNESDIREPVLLSPKTYPNGTTAVGYVDGRVMRLKADELAEIINKFE